MAWSTVVGTDTLQVYIDMAWSTVVGTDTFTSVH